MPARKVLLIFAHPDDAEFACGGSIARWCAEGCEVNYVLATSGDAGSHDLEMTNERLISIREEEQREAARVLGARECVFLRYRDGFVEDTAEFRGQIVRQIRIFRPDVVVTWDPFRTTFNHRDHRLTGQAALDAVYPLARSHLSYVEHIQEGLEPHRVPEALLAGPTDPNFYVDVSSHLETKIAALLHHKTQTERFPAKELRERMRERMAATGREVGFELAEAFRRIEWR